jgi:hypothetical protein
LPTSLTYIVLSTRGYSPWRPDAVMSTAGSTINLSLAFSRTVGKAPDTSEMTCFPSCRTLSPSKSIPGCVKLLKRKDNSSRTPRRRLRVHYRYRTISATRFGNINPIPFRLDGAVQVRAHFHTEFPYALGPTNPCPIDVHMEPFSTSVFKVLI